MCAIIPPFTYAFCSFLVPAPPSLTPYFLFHRSKENVPTLTTLSGERKINTSFAFVHSGPGPRRPLKWMWVFLLLLPGLGSGPSTVLLTRISAECEDRGGRSQGIGGNEWAACWKGGMKWRERAQRNWGGGDRKLGKLGEGAEVWNHEDILSLGLGAEAGLLTPLLPINICGHPLEACISCLLPPSVSFCKVSQLCYEPHQGTDVLWLQGGHALPASQTGVTLLPPTGISRQKGRWCFSKEGIASKTKQTYVKRASKWQS